MKRLVFLAIVGVAFGLLVDNTLAFAQGIFEIPFKFQAGGQKLPPGEYLVAQKVDGKITLRREPNGEEFQVPFIQRLPQPNPPLGEAQLVFDVVGNFEPSYTEYVTEYLLAEVWLPGGEGFLIHTTKGAHQNKVVKGQKATK